MSLLHSAVCTGRHDVQAGAAHSDNRRKAAQASSLGSAAGSAAIQHRSHSQHAAASSAVSGNQTLQQIPGQHIGRIGIGTTAVTNVNKVSLSAWDEEGEGSIAVQAISGASAQSACISGDRQTEDAASGAEGVMKVSQKRKATDSLLQQAVKKRAHMQLSISHNADVGFDKSGVSRIDEMRPAAAADGKNNVQDMEVDDAKRDVQPRRTLRLRKPNSKYL